MADEPGQSRGVMPGEIKDEIQWRAPTMAFGVVKVAAIERDAAKQGVNVGGTVVVDDFSGQRRGVVGDQFAIIEQLLDEVPRVAREGVAQSGLEPFGQVVEFLRRGDFLAGLGEEGFRFAVFFCKALGLEVFFSAIAPSSVVSPALRAMVFWMLSWASWSVSCLKRFASSMSCLRVVASSAETRLLRLRPSCQTWYLK